MHKAPKSIQVFPPLRVFAHHDSPESGLPTVTNAQDFTPWHRSVKPGTPFSSKGCCFNTVVIY
jgi:hypothetical protein